MQAAKVNKRLIRYNVGKVSKNQETVKSRLLPKLIIAAIVILFMGVALYLRVYLPYDQVFSGEWVKLTSVDAYYHMRLIDNLAYNFPHFNTADPYMVYPTAIIRVGGFHFFDWLLAGTIWVISLGSPNQQIIDTVAVYFPPIMAALTVIPVYFIGKELFGRGAGIISAGLISVLPGEFLGRSILGFTDHHVAEVLFSTTAILFLILAIKTSLQKGVTIRHVKSLDWETIKKPAIYSLLAGLFLGIYFITWAGALLFFFLISIYFFIQFTIDHLRQKSNGYLFFTGTLVFLIAALIFLPIYHEEMLYSASVVIALFIPSVLYGLSWLMARRNIALAYYPLVIVGAGLAGLVIIYFASPSFFSSILNSFRIFVPSGASLTTLEMQPILFPGGNFTLGIVWGNFTTAFFLGLISLFIVMIYYVIKRGEADKTLLIVWSLVILAATLGQRRFAYYLAINVALLAGYFSWLMFKLNKEGNPRALYLNIVLAVTGIFFFRFFSGFNPLLVSSIEILLSSYLLWQLLQFLRVLRSKPSEKVSPEKTAPGKNRKYGLRITLKQANMALAGVIIFFVAFFPNTIYAISTASQARFAPSDAWYSSLSWLRENSPDPFNNPDFYYQLYEPMPYPKYHDAPAIDASTAEYMEWYRLQRQTYNYPESAYGVTAWWDYGYWITRISHRLPSTTPGSSLTRTLVARFLLAQDEDSINEIRQSLDSSYVIIDHATANAKYWAIATWTHAKGTEYFDTYYLPQEPDLIPVRLYYPEYYRSLVTRLYNFDGKAVTPENTFVISYSEGVSQEGISYKAITGVEQFGSYEEAEAYLSSQQEGNYRIVSDNPFLSPVPLSPLKDYKLVYSSAESVTLPVRETPIPEVKIFKYVGAE